MSSSFISSDEKIIHVEGYDGDSFSVVSDI